MCNDDIFAAYAVSKLLRGNGEMVETPPIVGKALKTKCFIALSTIYFGIEHLDNSVTRRGLQRYGYALTELNQALGNPRLQKTSDTLEAVGLMTILEVG
jgi:hypothetical protein